MADGRRRLVPWLLLPAFALAWPGPGAPLAGDLQPQATGAGVAALLALPVAALLLLRGLPARVPALLPLLAPLLLGLAPLALGDATDTFEARRALLAWATAIAMLLGGAALDAPGRLALARGTVLVSLLLTGWAHVDASNGFAGATGNTGTTAQAALAGALAGAALLPTERGAWRWLGLAALVSFLAYVARVPVLAGALAAGAGLAARTRWPIRVGLLAALVAAAFLVPARHLGGLEVRARVHAAALPLVAEAPLVGVGLGQFAARFPPHRDPGEIELSSHARALEVETFVEHPHDDWLLPAIESGVAGGLAWMAFLLCGALAALRAARGTEPGSAALGSGAIALLVMAFLDAPLLGDPCTSPLAFALLGTLLAKPARGSGGRLLPLAALGLLLALAPVAWNFVRHGRALQDLATEADASTNVEAALAARPDSTQALRLRAALVEGRGEDARGAWEAVLARRPHDLEARMQLALGLVRAGDHAGAREQYERARALDPGHPGVLQNLMVLDLEDGRIEDARARYEALGERAPDAGWLLEMARRLESRGKLPAAAALRDWATRRSSGRS